MANGLRWSARAIALATGTALTACASYHPVTAPTVESRDQVRVALSDSGRIALTALIGPDVRSVEGTVRDRAADGAVTLTDVTLTLGDQSRRPGPPAPLALPAFAVTQMERRMLDKKRTRLTTAVIVGGFTAIVVSVLRSTRFRGQGQTAQGPGAPD